MSRIIADILDADTVKFNHLVEEWEKKTGYPRHDLSLYSDLRSRAIKAAENLGLDPTDTVSRELYFALQERARQDNIRLCRSIGVDQDDNPEVVIQKVTKWVLKKSLTHDVWVCKQTTLKSLLKKQPPKTTMKALSLRSVDSMLKRNSVPEILTIAYLLETPEWSRKFHLLYKKLKVADFDLTEIKTYVLDGVKSEKLIKAGYPKNQFATPNFESGSLVIMPYRNRFPLDVLASVVIIAEIMYEIRKHSSLFRLLSVRKDFGLQLSEISQSGVSRATTKIADIGWNSLHRHLIGNEFIVSKFEQPYLTVDDLRAESSIDFLVRNDPDFKYWKNLEYSFYHSDTNPPVSMNLIDVVVNSSNKAPHDTAHRRYGKMRLWEELWARYLQSDEVIEDVVDSYLRD